MSTKLSRFLVLGPLLAALAPGCGDKEDEPEEEAGPTLDPVCETPNEVSCTDQIILDLSLHDDKISEGEVATTVDGDDFVTVVDATAGGYNQAANNPWVYVKFTEDGAERLDIDDESALESMDWDMALRRYMLRLNSGVSGPSCVGASAVDGVEYGDLTELPEDVAYEYEAFYDEECELQEDRSGLPDSPDVVLGAWWTYKGSCVSTTLTPFLVQLADGHVMKLVVETYYGSGQDACNESGSSGDDSGTITLRWQMMNG